LNELLEAEGFDEFVEKRCAKFYAAKYGRPSLTPGIYFRSLLIGYFEGIGAERGIAWRLADSLALRRFVGISLDEYTPDHSTISRTRRLIDVDTHREVFSWVLGVLADRGLLQGQRIAIDATTLEANAAMHTMYVDKPLSGIKAVQTLSRLNRAHPQKHDCFVLDFQNNSEAITFAFQDYYRTTLLAEETDPNKLHDLKAALDAAQVYSPEQVQQVVGLFLDGADRDKLDPILDACVAVYVARLDEDGQVDFKGKAKVFCRTYSFLSSVIPYSNAEWEKLSILLNLLTPKLPAPQEEDLAKGILEAIDMDSYRVEKKAAMKIALADKDAEIEPVPTDTHGHKPEPELDRLSNILKTFNEQFGTLFTDTDRVAKRIRDDIAPKVAAAAAYQNAKENTPHTARMAHDQALAKVMQHLLKNDTQVYKQFVENESFKRFVGDMVYALTSQ
jgi:type I restriction enzyme R subunit